MWNRWSSGLPGVGLGMRRVGDVGRGVAVRPIVYLIREIRARLSVDERRRVDRLLVGEAAGRIERHVLADERRGGADTAHPRADVVGLRPPQRRRHRRALTGRPVAPGAAG